MEYVKYDNHGNEIEVGEYGELSRFVRNVEEEDGSTTIISGSIVNRKNLNTVAYKKYDTDGNIIEEEIWKFKDNEKDYLIYRTKFFYADGKLTKEVDFDEDGQVIRERSYDVVSAVRSIQMERRDKMILGPMVRINGNSVDSIEYDTTGRIKEMTQYFNGKFLLREVYMYDTHGMRMTKIRYEHKPDSLFSFTEHQYDILAQEPISVYWKVLNSNVEQREEYVYDRKRRLKRVLRSDAFGPTGGAINRYR